MATNDKSRIGFVVLLISYLGSGVDGGLEKTNLTIRMDLFARDSSTTPMPLPSIGIVVLLYITIFILFCFRNLC